MTIVEILHKELFGKKIKADVEAYDSVICQMHYPKQQVINITSIDESSIEGEIAIRGVIIDGDYENQSCSLFVFIDTKLNII